MNPIVALVLELISTAWDIFKANKAGDGEAEHQAILKANRLTSNEIARREASQ